MIPNIFSILANDVIFCVAVFVQVFPSTLTAAWMSTINPMTFSQTTLSKLFDHGGYTILSAGRNPALPSEFNITEDAIRNRTKNLAADLTKLYLYSDIVGMYDGASEVSFFVILHNVFPEHERQAMINLGQKYNQDSIIYVRQTIPIKQQLIYTTGPLSGKFVVGQGYSFLSLNATDNYSAMNLCPTGKLIFTLNFDFEHMLPATNRTKTQLLTYHHALNRAANNLRRFKQITDLAL